MKPDWSDRPQKGDTVETIPPGITGVVVETFYEVGDGIHVRNSCGWTGWASYKRVRVVKRAPMPEEK